MMPFPCIRRIFQPPERGPAPGSTPAPASGPHTGVWAPHRLRFALLNLFLTSRAGAWEEGREEGLLFAHSNVLWKGIYTPEAQGLGGLSLLPFIPLWH